MNIEQALDEKIMQADGGSVAVMAERCEKSAEHPDGIKKAEKINSDEMVVVGVLGTVSRSYAPKATNGFLKMMAQFVENEPKLKGVKVRLVAAVCDFGKYFDKDTAEELMLLEQNNSLKAQTLLSSLSKKEQQEMTIPGYVKDIYDFVLDGRFRDQEHNIRLSLPKALKKTRKTMFLAYCWGGYTILKLEKMMQNQMKNLNYTAEEQKLILSQMLSVAYSPSCPIGINQSRMVSFSSASDTKTKHNNYAKDFLQINMNPPFSGVPDFGYMWLDSKAGNIFYCAQYNKYGVEGNKLIIVAREIDDVEDLLKAEDKKDRGITEHEFLGFVAHPSMSKAACRIQKFANQIIVNGILHAVKQPECGYDMLPNTRRLAANSLKDHWDLFKAYRWGEEVKLCVKKYGKEKVLRDSYANRVKFVSLD